MRSRVVVLGAGFGGLELATVLSESLGEDVEVTLIDRAESFVFGFSKLDVLFGRQTLEELKLPYSYLAKAGVRFVKDTVTAIDPTGRRVTTERGVYEGDYLVVALGADYDFDATPGLAQATEFYSLEGAMRMAELLPSFTSGHALIGVCGAPFKCPPAPSEAALLLHDHLTTRGIRDACEISFVLPLPSPVPPSPDTSKALLDAFAERDIKFIPVVASPRLTMTAPLRCSTMAVRSPTTSSSGCQSTAPPTWCSRVGWPRRGTSPWIPARSKHASPGFTPWGMSLRSVYRRPGYSPRAPPAW